MKIKWLPVALLLTLTLSPPAEGAQRFPRPELPPGYEQPVTEHPSPRLVVFEYLDVALLALALGLAAWLVLRRRSRRLIFVLMLLSLAYFGFYRKGCVCPIGAIQHVTSAAADAGFAIPAAVLLFFLLPLVFALFFGRVFCSGVCPLGAAQDLVLLRPLKVPRWLEHGLGLFAYVYLGLAVLFAAGGAGYVICRYDPFVPFFRLSGGPSILLLGGCALVVSMFVGRPYCRFLCPLGVLLRLAGRVSWKRVTITPDECVKCRLCEDACPFGAIRKPTEAAERTRTEGKAMLALMLVAVPLIVALGGFAGRIASAPLARAHPTVIRAGEVRHDAALAESEPGKRTLAFQKTGRSLDELYAEEVAVKAWFRTGGAVFGAYLGLVAAFKLVSLSVRRRRADYEADRSACLACGRCYAFCPRERVRLGKQKETVR